MNIRKAPQLPRRRFLRGAGAVMALPLLEAMMPRSAASAAVQTPPKRYAFVYTPNGYVQDRFIPAGTGTDWQLPPSLSPLESIKQEVTLVTGLDRAFVPGTGVHAQAGCCWLTSSPPSETKDGGFPTNKTVDQIIASKLGRETMLPSLELSCNDHTNNKETKYFECISWYAPGYAVNTEKNPRAVFNRLFGQESGGASKSVLDTVLEDAQGLRAQLGRTDQGKLDEFLDSVRATERRIELAEAAASRRDPSVMPQPQGIPDHRGEYLRMMADLFIIAFQQDLTRVATLVVDPERWDTPRMYHDVFDKPQNHHVLTHTKGDEAKETLAEIDRFHVDYFRYIVERMKSIPEGDGTLLDNSLVSFGSGMSDGKSHNYRDLQVLLAGKAQKPFTPGRHLNYGGERPLADLWLSVLGTAGIEQERFADSTGPLNDLIA